MASPRPRVRFPKAAARDTSPTRFGEILADLVRGVPGATAAVLVDREGEAVDYAGRGSAFDIRVAGAHWQIVARALTESLAARSPVAFGAFATLVVRAARASFIVRALPDGYVVVVLLSRRAGFVASSRAFAAGVHALGVEAGWVTAEGARSQLPPPPRTPVPPSPFVGTAASRARFLGAVTQNASPRPSLAPPVRVPRLLSDPWSAVSVDLDPFGRPARVRVLGRPAPPAPTPSASYDLEILGTFRSRPWSRRAEPGYRVRIVLTGQEVTLVREASGCWYASDSPQGPRAL